MPSLKDLMKAVKNDLPVTLRHERWLAENANAHYSPEALQFAQDVLSGAIGGHRYRQQSFRSSGQGSCRRKRVFAFIGMQPLPDNDTARTVFLHTGSFMHLKWQMAGLTAGWLTQAEVPAYNPVLNLTGTMDGLVYDGSLFEFKSINHRGFGWVMKEGPKPDHLMQTTAYEALDPEIEATSVVYEDKDTGEWREFRSPRDPQRMGEFVRELEDLNRHITSQQLPPILPDCSTQEGRVYRQCPFRDRCLKIKGWPV